MRILHVNTLDKGGGGASVIASALHSGQIALGMRSHLLVSKRNGDLPCTTDVSSLGSRLSAQTLLRAMDAWTHRRSLRIPGLNRLQGAVEAVLCPSTLLDRLRGYEPSRFRWTESLRDFALSGFDVVHCHNLHGEYFDLRLLATLSPVVPTLLTLHDEWTYTGHCASSMNCDRWLRACGSCPALDSPPRIRRDETKRNHEWKRSVYEQSALYVVGPSHWSIERAKTSVLSKGVLDWQVIPNGVDIETFTPGNRANCRAALGIHPDAIVLMFAAYDLHNPYKDFASVRECVSQLTSAGIEVTCLAVGALKPSSRSKGPILTVPFEDDRGKLADLFAASDIYLHGTKAESWGLTVTEAMACGLPVVASAVGGVLDQVVEGVTGFLVPIGDSKSMFLATKRLVEDVKLRRSMGQAARERVESCFSSARMVTSYVTYYERIIRHHAGGPACKQYSAD